MITQSQKWILGTSVAFALALLVAVAVSTISSGDGWSALTVTSVVAGAVAVLSGLAVVVVPDTWFGGSELRKAKVRADGEAPDKFWMVTQALDLLVLLENEATEETARAQHEESRRPPLPPGREKLIVKTAKPVPPRENVADLIVEVTRLAALLALNGDIKHAELINEELREILARVPRWLRWKTQQAHAREGRES